MRFEFFPSPTLTWYLARTFITRILAVLVMLVLVLQMLDLLSESGKILAFEGNGQGELWRYVSLRTPQLIARFLPYSVLLATLITLATLNQNSEVVAMKSAGLSAHQILAPLLLTAAGVTLVSFAFNERIVTHATSALKVWSNADYGPIPEEPVARSNVYFADGTDVLMASTMSGSGDTITMQGVTFYDRDEAGMIRAELRADTATYVSPGWRLDNPVRFTVETAETDTLTTLIVAEGLSPDQAEISSVDPDAQNALELRKSINSLKSAGRRTSELEGAWWHKFSGPLSALLMPLLGAVAGFGLARSGKLFVRAVVGMFLGFAYFVVDNAALAMGNFGAYPPFIAAWAPFFLFLLVGETVLIKTEE